MIHMFPSNDNESKLKGLAQIQPSVSGCVTLLHTYTLRQYDAELVTFYITQTRVQDASVCVTHCEQPYCIWSSYRSQEYMIHTVCVPILTCK